MNLKLIGRIELNGKKITLDDSDGVVLKTKFGLPDNWYGGTVKEFRKIKNSKYLMCLDKKDKIINIAYDEDEPLEGSEKIPEEIQDEIQDETDNDFSPRLGKNKSKKK